MKTLKGFILIVIALCTAMAILYLVFQAKKLERYTGVIDNGDKCYIVLSTEGGGIKNGKKISEILNFSVDFLKQSGMDAALVEETKNDKIKKEIVNLMKRDRKYILVDINPTKLISNEGTVLIRLGKKNNPNYENNLVYATKLKEIMSSKYNNIKVNIIGDSKNSYNQDLGHNAVRIEISHNISYENAKILMSYVLETMAQLE